MLFQINKDEIYYGIPDIIKKEFPDFNSLFNKDDGVYLIFGDFLEYLSKNKSNIYLLQKACRMFNQLLTEGGTETEELIIIQISDYFENDNVLISFFKENVDKRFGLR